MVVHIPNPIDPIHLEMVKADMLKNGAPIIRAYEYDGELYAIEGSHRVTAARDLGIPIIIEYVNPDDVIKVHDIQDLPETTTVNEIIEYITSKPYDYVVNSDIK